MDNDTIQEAINLIDKSIKQLYKSGKLVQEYNEHINSCHKIIDKQQILIRKLENK